LQLGRRGELIYLQHRESLGMTPLYKSTTFHRSALIVTALLATGLFAATVRADDYAKTYTVSNRANVHIDTDDGSVVVTTTGDTKQVEFRVEYQGYTLDKSLHIDSSQHGDEVELVARIPHGFHISLGMMRRLHIEVRMPKDADLEVRTGDGSIKANNVSGTIDLHSGDGALTVSALKGTVRMHTGDGSIEASDMDGKCDASSGDGRIRLAGRFDVLSAKSGDGSIAIEALHGSKLDSSWSITSGDGGIDVALPGDLAANIEASSGDGHISTDIPITMEGVISKSKVHGKMNGGGSTLTIHTGDGSIHLKQV
jgi:Putative adhesin